MTEFGKRMRILRVERGEVLKDMSSKLGVTSSYLSAIECGKRRIPEDLVDRISTIYGISEEKKHELEDAKAITEKQVEIVIPLQGLNQDQRDVFLKLARSFKDSPSKDMSSVVDELRRYFENKEEK